MPDGERACALQGRQSLGDPTAISDLPVLLRVYEGCARALLGEVPGATITKLRRDKPKVSYLCYPGFDDEPHPPLKETFVADLKELRTRHYDYSTRDNPPILHRKELLVAMDYPLRGRFAELTNQETDAGLLNDGESIGTREGWQRRLLTAGYRTDGHSLVRLAANDSA